MQIGQGEDYIEEQIHQNPLLSGFCHDSKLTT
jgi:hypothetical protein